MAGQNKFLRSLLAGTAALGAQALPGAAYAQSAAAQAQSDRTTAIEEIIVTAQKRSERLSDTPMAVTAVTSDALQSSGAVSLRDLTASVPGLQVGAGLGAGSFALRGITTGTDGNSTVGMQIDGVPIGPTAFGATGGIYMPELDPAVLSRVEVLRGPQGTLYGSSTLGGIINYVTRRPSLSAMSGSLYAEGASTNEGDAGSLFRGVLSAPIAADTAAVQLSAFYGDAGGFIDNRALGRDDINSRRSYGGRAAILFKPTPRFTLQLADLYSNLRSVQDAVPYDAATQRPLGGDLVNNNAVAQGYDNEFNIASVNADYDLGWGTASAILSDQTLNAHNDVDFSAAGLASVLEFVLPGLGGAPLATPANTGAIELLKTRKRTAELRLSSNENQQLSWIVGGFYNDESSSHVEHIASFDTHNSPNPGLGSLLRFDFLSNYTEYAGFGNLTYTLNSRLDLTAGLRVQRIEQDFRELFGGVDAAALNTLFTGLGYLPTPSDSGVTTSGDDVVTYLANARYRFSPTNMVYFRFATGFRPGGPNTLVPGLPRTFDPDTTRDYELGWKTSVFDGRGFVDLSLYHIIWDEIQVLTLSQGINGRTNGGRAKSNGVEGSLRLEPIDGLTLSGTLAYSDAKLSENIPGFLGNKGDRMPMNPQWSGSISGDYEWAAVGGWRPFAGLSANYVGEREAGFASSLAYAPYTLPSYTIVNLRGGVRSDNLELGVFVRNLTDDRAQLGATTITGTTVAVARPRTIGVSLNLHY
jgi:iron complex outermembrane recepter protein